jgi:hypothetical protein
VDVHTDRDFRLAAFNLARHLKAVPALRDRVGRLIGLCRQLQHENEYGGRGAGFCLSGYVAAKLLKVSQRTAAAWLAMLVADGVLEVVDVGGGFRGGRRMAREYRMAEPAGGF